MHEVIDLFGAQRCMFSTNWWLNGAMANADGRDEVEISMANPNPNPSPNLEEEAARQGEAHAPAA